MRGELAPISRLLGEMREDHLRLEKSHAELTATARQIGSLFESLRNEVEQLGALARGASAAAAMPAAIRRIQLLEQKYLQLQMAMQRENLVFTSVSNVLKTRHDTAKNSISNVR